MCGCIADSLYTLLAGVVNSVWCHSTLCPLCTTVFVGANFIPTLCHKLVGVDQTIVLQSQLVQHSGRQLVEHMHEHTDIVIV